MKLTVFFLALSIFSFIGFLSGQTMSESTLLQKVNNSKTSLEKCNALNELSRFYLYYNPSVALERINESIELSKRISSNEAYLKAKINEGFYFLRIDDYVKSNEILESIKKLATNLKDNRSLGEIKQIQARVYNGRGQYDMSIKLLLSAQENLQLANDNAILGRVFETIGDINDKFGNTKMAVENLKKSIEYKIKYGDDIELSRSYSYLGNVYFRENQFDKSIAYYDTAILLSNKNLNFNSLSYSYSRKARVLIELKKDYDANELLKKAFVIAERQKNYWLMTRVYISQSKILENGLKLDSSLNYANEALKIAIKTKDDEGQSFCYKQLTNIHKKLGDYKSAFANLEKREELVNKIWNNNISSVITTKELEFKNQSKIDQLKQDQEQKELIAQKEKEADDKVFLILIVFIISILAFGIYITYRYRIERKQKKIIEKQGNENYILLKSFSKQDQNTALNEIASRIAHEVNSPLSAVQSSAQAIQSLIRKSDLKVLIDMNQYDFQLFIKIIQSDKSAHNYIGKARRQRAELFSQNLSKYSDFDKNLIKELSLRFAELPYDIDETKFKEIIGCNNPLNMLKALIIIGKIEYFSMASFDAAQRISDKVIELKKYLVSDEDDSLSSLNLENAIQTVVDLFQYETDGRIEIKLNLLENFNLEFNSSKFYQIIYNIVKNSIESFDDTIKNPSIQIETRKAKDHLTIVISNNGQPIPLNSTDLIFDYFYTTKDGAPGLGLSIAKNHVESVNGRITAESTQEKTSFKIFIPIR